MPRGCPNLNGVVATRDKNHLKRCVSCFGGVASIRNASRLLFNSINFCDDNFLLKTLDGMKITPPDSPSPALTLRQEHAIGFA